MLHVLVCSESQRAVRACRPERHRRPRRRRCTRFEARRRPGGPQAAEQRRKDASTTVQRSACRGRRFRVKRERTLTASQKGADESVFLWVPKRRLDEARFSSIRCDGTVPISSDSAQQSIARIGGGKKNRLPSLEAPTVAQSAAPCRGAGPLGMRSAPPVTYEHAPGASNSPNSAQV